jgi:hypothetical protein
MQTAGRWSWKSKAAKKCVTTYLPNEVAPKMDGAEANDLIPTMLAFLFTEASMSRKASW